MIMMMIIIIIIILIIIIKTIIVIRIIPINIIILPYNVIIYYNNKNHTLTTGSYTGLCREISTRLVRGVSIHRKITLPLLLVLQTRPGSIDHLDFNWQTQPLT